jgi:hypothetical protein
MIRFLDFFASGSAAMQLQIGLVWPVHRHLLEHSLASLVFPQKPRNRNYPGCTTESNHTFVRPGCPARRRPNQESPLD